MEERVLIVEDTEDLRMLWRAFLERNGFVVDEAGDGRQALERIATSRPDAILLDGRLPDLSGWDVLSTIVGDEELRSVPVIMVTGDVGMEERAASEGAAACLTKPVSMMQLVTTVKEALANAIR